METSHLRSGLRVGHPGRESNPVLPLSQGEAVVQTQGALENLRSKCDSGWYDGISQGEVVQQRGLRAPLARLA